MRGILADKELEGIIPRSLKQIFNEIKNHTNTTTFKVYLSFYAMRNYDIDI